MDIATIGTSYFQYLIPSEPRLALIREISSKIFKEMLYLSIWTGAACLLCSSPIIAYSLIQEVLYASVFATLITCVYVVHKEFTKIDTIKCKTDKSWQDTCQVQLSVCLKGLREYEIACIDIQTRLLIIKSLIQHAVASVLFTGVNTSWRILTPHLTLASLVHLSLTPTGAFFGVSGSLSLIAFSSLAIGLISSIAISTLIHKLFKKDHDMNELALTIGTQSLVQTSFLILFPFFTIPTTSLLSELTLLTDTLQYSKWTLLASVAAIHFLAAKIIGKTQT